LPKETLAFFANDRVYESIYDFNIPDEDTVKILDQVQDKLKSIDRLTGIGTYLSDAYALVDETSSFPFLAYNDEMVFRLPLSLSKGRWFDNGSQVNGIPIIIGGVLTKVYEPGDRILLQVVFQSNGSIQTIEGIVIGELAVGSAYYTFAGGATDPGILSVAEFSEGDENPDNGVLICPMSALGSYPQRSVSPSCFLFFDDGADLEDIKDSLNQAMTRYGQFVTVAEMNKHEMSDNIMHIYNHDIINAASLILMMIFGCGGYILLTYTRNRKVYGVYMLCGMSRKRLLCQFFLNTALIFIPPVVVSIILIPKVVDRSLINWVGYSISFGSVVLTAGLCCLLALYQCYGREPIEFIEE
jgi:ABC-type antimicrobial peptide transport system permease subunit